MRLRIFFHDFTVNTIDGESFDFSALKGKKVLVVNGASKCGFTSQYAGLEELYEEYGPEGFVALGLPANNFMGQEPGLIRRSRSFAKILIRSPFL